MSMEAENEEDVWEEYLESYDHADDIEREENYDRVIDTRRKRMSDCRKCCVCDFKDALCDEDFCEKYYREGSAEDFEKLLPHWIPCSERLPEDLEEVNVTWVNHNPAPYYNFVKDKPFTGSAVYYKEKWYWYSSKCADILCEYGENDIDEVDDAIEIIAWMPLPEPYGERRTDG